MVVRGQRVGGVHNGGEGVYGNVINDLPDYKGCANTQYYYYYTYIKHGQEKISNKYCMT